MKNILFKFDVDNGALAGTGHFFRCLNIYNILKKKYNRKLGYYFLFKNNKDSKNIVRKHISKNIIIYNNKFKSKISFLKENDLIINDTPKKIDSKFLKYCKDKPVKNLILVDHDKINFPYQYYLINGIFYFRKKLKKEKNIFQGFSYIFLDKNSSIKKAKKNGIFKILITTGGTDNKNIIYKIYNYLKKIPNLFFYIIIGPGFKKNNPILNIKDKNVFFVKNKTDLKPYYQKVDLSITGGGISMFESIQNKKLTLVTELFKNQKYSIKKLNKLNMISIIGKNRTIYEKKLVKIVKNIIKSKKKNNIKYPKNFKLIDGKSILRIEKIIFKVISRSIN